MAGNKGGRKRLGNKKRAHAITLRFNGTELEKIKTILQSYNLDFGKRGTVGLLHAYLSGHYKIETGSRRKV